VTTGRSIRAPAPSCARYTVHTPAGPKRKPVYGRTRAEAAEKLAKALADRERGLAFDAGNATIGEYLTCWLEDCVQSSVKPITYESYERLVRVHIAPALGHLKLKGLTPPHVRALYRSKLEAGLSPSTVQYFRLMKSRAPEMTPGVVTEKQPSQGRDGGHHVDITSVTSRSARR
jgi:integrase